MTSDDRGYGPDDMGDDEQETEVAEWERYIEDPPEGELEVTEDDGNDARDAYDWAERHPRAAGPDPGTDDEPAEHTAIRERRSPLRGSGRPGALTAPRANRRTGVMQPHPPRRRAGPAPGR
jgi:hypothetical protein